MFPSSKSISESMFSCKFSASSSSSELLFSSSLMSWFSQSIHWHRLEHVLLSETQVQILFLQCYFLQLHFRSAFFRINAISLLLFSLSHTHCSVPFSYRQPWCVGSFFECCSCRLVFSKTNFSLSERKFIASTEGMVLLATNVLCHVFFLIIFTLSSKL